MSGPKPGSAPNMSAMPSMGGSEAPDEAAMKQMMSGGANSPGGQSSPTSSSKPQQPRAVGSIKEEVKAAVGDIWGEVKQFFKLSTWTGINPDSMTPDQQAKAQEIHTRYGQLTQEQQQAAQEMYQERMQKEKVKEEEAQMHRQRDAQKSQSVAMPSGPQKGPKGPGGNKKSNAMQQLQQDRTTIGKMQGE